MDTRSDTFDKNYKNFMKEVRTRREGEYNQAIPRPVASASETNESSGAAASGDGNKGKFTREVT